MPPLRLACLAVLASVSLASAKSYVADRYDVRIQVQPDASLLVTETIRFHFEEGHFSYVSRVLPQGHTDGVSGIRTAIDGAPTPADVEESSDGIRIRWRFDAGDESVHDFSLDYRVAGAIRTESGRGVLEWRTLPQQHDYTILAGEVQVEYPAGIELLAPPELQAAVAARRDAHRSVFTLPELGPNRGALLLVNFPSGFAIEPAWQIAESQRQSQASAALGTGGLAALLFSAIGIAALARYRRSLPAHPRLPAAPPTGHPPADLPPAISARLLGSAVGVPAALGTLLDLARRGFVVIRQAGRRTFGQKAWWIEPRAAAQNLLPFEEAILSLAFGGEFPPRPAGFAAFLSKVSASPSAFSRPLEQHMLSTGLLDPERLRIRNRGCLVTALVMFGGVAACIGGIVWGLASARSGDPALPFAAAAAGVGAAAFAIGMAGLFLSASFSPLTREGAASAQSWRGFRDGLRAIVRQKLPAAPEEFERLLPFATAFGLGSAWVRRFRKGGQVPPPEWFEMDDGAADMAFFDFVAASTASADSSGSGGGSDGGSSSAAGGGSSSAG